MSMPLTGQQIIADAKKRGAAVTGPQIARWRSIHLLPSGIRHSRGRGLGTYWLFPNETIDLVVAIAPLAVAGTPLNEIGVALWLQGVEYEEAHVRAWLDETIRRPRDLIENGDPAAA